MPNPNEPGRKPDPIAELQARIDAALEEILSELRGGNTVGAGQFGILDFPVLHLIQGARHILSELGTEAIELQAERTLEARAGTY